MKTRRALQLVVSFCILASSGIVAAHVNPDQANGEEPPPSTWKNNATLRDVFFLNQRLGWAVGDQGTILRTEDAGLTWSLVYTNQSCSLCSVYFVDEMNGWAAGGNAVPLVDRTHAVILRTR